MDKVTPLKNQRNYAVTYKMEHKGNRVEFFDTKSKAIVRLVEIAERKDCERASAIGKDLSLFYKDGDIISLIRRAECTE